MRKTQEVAVLSSVAELLTSPNLDDVLSKTLGLLTETVEAERGSFFVFNQGSRTAQHIITRRNLPPERSQLVVDRVLDQGLAGWVYRHKQAALITDTSQDDRWVTFEDDKSPVGSVLCVPFLAEGQINGIMTLEHSQRGFFNQADLALATAVANQTTIVIRNAQLFDRVQTHERQLEAVLESIAAPLLTISPHNHLQLANPAALALLGMTAETAHGLSLNPSSANPIVAEIARHLDQENERFELHDPDTGTDFAGRVSSWREGDTNELGHVIVLNDVTVLKELARLKSQMLEMASHDLRSPLGTLLGYAELLLMDMPPEDPNYPYVQDMQRVAKRMLGMVTDLLDLTRIESAAKRDYEWFDLAPVLDEVLSHEKPDAEDKHQTFRTDIEAPLPRLYGAPNQIREAFANLIGNAIKYTPEGGMILVRAAVDPARKRFNFAVQDNGYGIPEKFQARIFERFYRAKQPGTENITGTGLGLSLVKTVIENHSGQVWFKSEADKGSVFGFWLPLQEESDEPPSERAD